MVNRILFEADKAVERGTKNHGNTKLSFLMTAELWSIYINHATIARNDTKLLPTDVAQMMSLLKKARALYGAYHEDHWVDDAGYVALAATLKGESK